MAGETPIRPVPVVDDDDDLREVLTTALAREGPCVDGACDGAEALALLERQPYDLVRSVLRMPGTDGPSLCETLRTRHHFPVRFATKLPRVIFMTGNAAEHADFLRGTTDPILEKPFPLRVVRPLVSVLLNATAA